jgi:hypothetical protein
VATARDICSNALLELGAYAPGDTPSANDINFALNKFNQLVDSWNAVNSCIFAKSFDQYTIVTNTQPLTIGPTGANYTATVRPVEVIAANVIITDGDQDVRVPLNIRDEAWWMANSVPGVIGTIPTDLFYNPTWPLGKLYLWPIPTVANVLELETNGLISTYALATTFTMPPGYEKALTLTLAEDMQDAFGKYPQNLPGSAAKARAIIKSVNSKPPRMSMDAGIPNQGSGSQRGDFNWLTGNVTK